MKYFLIFLLFSLSVASLADIQIVEVGNLTESQKKAVFVFNNYGGKIGDQVVIVIGVLSSEGALLKEDIVYVAKTTREFQASVLILETNRALELKEALVEDLDFEDLYLLVASRKDDYLFSVEDSVTPWFLYYIMQGESVRTSFIKGNNLVNSSPCLFLPVSPIVQKDRKIATTWAEIKR